MKLKGPTRLVVLGIKLIIETAAVLGLSKDETQQERAANQHRPSAPVRFRMDWAH